MSAAFFCWTNNVRTEAVLQELLTSVEPDSEVVVLKILQNPYNFALLAKFDGNGKKNRASFM